MALAVKSGGGKCRSLCVDPREFVQSLDVAIRGRGCQRYIISTTASYSAARDTAVNIFLSRRTAPRFCVKQAKPGKKKDNKL